MLLTYLAPLELLALARLLVMLGLLLRKKLLLRRKQMKRLLVMLFVSMFFSSCSTTTSTSDLAAIQSEWQLQRFQIGDGGEVRVPDPSRYTARFDPDDRTVNIQADCNTCRGTYTTDGTSLSIGALGCTLALCPPGSLSDDYLRALSGVRSFRRGDTWLELNASGEDLVFYLEP
jgi:heat shock protein HslJ